MKTILAGVAAALALSTLSLAYADDMSVQITQRSPQRYYLQEYDFHDFKGTFLLENGQEITFSSRMNHYYTQLGNGERTRIYAVSPTAFVTENGARVEFTDKGETVGIANFGKLPGAGKLASGDAIVMARR
ncbi:hypothetical protein SAMN05216319_3175 [Duganella sp. CF402]|uniref:hypothetical protein n=1 Tax=unclassified Duganella TaxID=2636909 RepID=UPI0008BF2268|nr:MULTISPECIES: hypothetical protein [unclassified Duganella]RZT08411.1 hypothetical protein EV582_0444 [Duganella sp. BK701]SEL94890.1 hypothetical protein SAMN05216319_3175 [Duganella sp. CF402]